MTGSICSSATADWPAGRATGATTGCGNSSTPAKCFLSDPRCKKTLKTNGSPVGKDIKLKASDNFELGAYRADPATAPKAAVVVIQEIFGVNHHIRAVCDRLAAEGYVAIAPAIFDRVEPNFTSGYTPDEIAIARKFVANPDWAAMLGDTQAAIDAVRDVGPIGIIGFCLGGSIPYAAAHSRGDYRVRSAITAGLSCASPTTDRRCRRNCISARTTPESHSAMSRS